MARGGKRENAGRKPGSKSMLTVTLKATLTETAKQYTADAIVTLVEIMSDTKAPPAARAHCATAILDRGWGRPIQATAPAPEDTGTPPVADNVIGTPGSTLVGTLDAIRATKRPA